MSQNSITFVSYAVAIAVFFGSFVFFYNVTQEIWGSLAAAVMTAVLAWISYVLVRWLILALKK